MKLIAVDICLQWRHHRGYCRKAQFTSRKSSRLSKRSRSLTVVLKHANSSGGHQTPFTGGLLFIAAASVSSSSDMMGHAIAHVNTRHLIRRIARRVNCRKLNAIGYVSSVRSDPSRGFENYFGVTERFVNVFEHSRKLRTSE